MTKTVSFLKTTAIGGLIFLLPLVVVGALVGQIIQILLPVAKPIAEHSPVHTMGGVSILALAAIAVILAACFLAGLVARRSIGRKFSQTIEKNVLLLFPRYAILKDQMASTVGGDESIPSLKPVLLRFDDHMRVAFEVDRSAGGKTAVYLPGSPDAWAGAVAFVDADRVSPLELPFADAVGICEQMGRRSLDKLGLDADLRGRLERLGLAE